MVSVLATIVDAMTTRLTIDCAACPRSGSGCSDCLVSFFYNHASPAQFSPDERYALGNLAAAGLIPPVESLTVVDDDSLIDEHTVSRTMLAHQGSVALPQAVTA